MPPAQKAIFRTVQHSLHKKSCLLCLRIDCWQSPRIKFAFFCFLIYVFSVQMLNMPGIIDSSAEFYAKQKKKNERVKIL